MASAKTGTLGSIETRSDAILTAMRECHRIGANDIYARDVANILNIPQKNAVAAMNKMATQKKIERELSGGEYLYRIPAKLRDRPKKKAAKKQIKAISMPVIEDAELKMDVLADLQRYLHPDIGIMLAKIANDLNTLVLLTREG